MCTSRLNVKSRVIKPLAFGLLEWKFMSRALQYTHTDDSVIDDFPKIFDHFPKISEDSPKFIRKSHERCRTFSEKF